MDLSIRLYLALVIAVAIGRLCELVYSRANQLRLRAYGSRPSVEPGYKWMVALHISILLGACLEVVLLQRPWIPLLGLPALVLFLSANAMRWWVIHTLGERWNVQVMSPSSLGIITTGPYRWLRHPNYTAVYLELLALPLIHTAWITASLGALAHLAILRRRVQLEESVLVNDPAWRMAFAAKPRFLP